MRARRFAPLVFLACLPAAARAGGTLGVTAADFAAGSAVSTEAEESVIRSAGGWQSASTPLSARYDAAFSYDGSLGYALLFGGHDQNGTVFGDAWTYSSSGGWTAVASTGPSARYGHGLAAVGGKFVLFGGYDGAGAPLADTWLYDPATGWAEVFPSTSPEARAHFAMAYDSGRGLVAVYGGEGTAGPVNGFTWLYDVAASTWTQLSLTPFPQPRTGCSMAYDASAGRFVLFGGRDSALDFDGLYGDVWAFDPAGPAWSLRASGPPARTDGAMLYDAARGKTVYFGGRVSAAGHVSDVWFYDYADDVWTPFVGEAGAPPGRFGHAMTFETAASRGLVFGGRQDIASSLLRSYTFASSGAWTSAPLDAWTGFGSTRPAPLSWTGLTAAASIPSGTDLRLQLAHSPDGGTFDDFRGPDGSTATYYLASATAQAVWTGHADKRFMKVRAFFETSDAPSRPQAASITLAYNRAPFAPAPSSPADGARLNDDTPAFSWTTSVDPDNDAPLSFRFETDDDPGFGSPEAVSTQAGLSFTPPELPEGTRFWRVRAEDSLGLPGDWSAVFDLIIDTQTPPSAVTQIAGSLGPGNGSVSLAWTFPGDDKGAVAGGLSRVRFAAAPVSDETAWSAAAERTFALTAAPGDTVLSVITGLAGATTYYFAIKTQDELGNLSPLSTASPAVLTNAAPSVTLIAPVGGGLVVGTTQVSWSASDPNPGDDPVFDLDISSGAGWTPVAVSLPPGATQYAWDSRLAPNGAWSMRVTARDARGLSDSDASGSFTVDNANEPPVVTVTAPAAFQRATRDLAVQWQTADPNATNTHVYAVSVSSDGGTTFTQVAAGLAAASYVLDTRAWPNGDDYRVRIEALDSGTPPLTGTGTSARFEVLNSSAPGAFRALHPAQDGLPSLVGLEFRWSESLDPEDQDLAYDFYLSTDAALAGAPYAAGLAETRFAPSPGALAVDATYYWYVVARDPVGESARTETSRFFLSRRAARTPDGFLLAEADGLPAGAWLTFEDAASSDGALLESAERDARADRLVESLGLPVWRVRVRGLDGAAADEDGVTLRLRFRAPAARPAPGALGAPVRHMRAARLDPSRARWEPLPSGAAGEDVVASAPELGVFGLVASPAPSSGLSGVTNFPNPFAAGKEETRLRYVLTEDSHVTVRIYTPAGDLVRRLEAAPGLAGGQGTAAGFTNEVLWDGRNGAGDVVANGLYLAEILAESPSGTRRETRRVGVVK